MQRNMPVRAGRRRAAAEPGPGGRDIAPAAMRPARTSPGAPSRDDGLCKESPTVITGQRHPRRRSGSRRVVTTGRGRARRRRSRRRTVPRSTRNQRKWPITSDKSDFLPGRAPVRFTHPRACRPGRWATPAYYLRCGCPHLCVSVPRVPLKRRSAGIGDARRVRIWYICGTGPCRQAVSSRSTCSSAADSFPSAWPRFSVTSVIWCLLCFGSYTVEITSHPLRFGGSDAR